MNYINLTDRWLKPIEKQAYDIEPTEKSWNTDKRWVHLKCITCLLIVSALDTLIAWGAIFVSCVTLGQQEGTVIFAANHFASTSLLGLKLYYHTLNIIHPQPKSKESNASKRQTFLTLQRKFGVFKKTTYAEITDLFNDKKYRGIAEEFFPAENSVINKEDPWVKRHVISRLGIAIDLIALVIGSVVIIPFALITAAFALLTNFGEPKSFATILLVVTAAFASLCPLKIIAFLNPKVHDKALISFGTTWLRA